VSPLIERKQTRVEIDASHFVETVETPVQIESVSDVNSTVTDSLSCPLPKFLVGHEKQPFHMTGD
jgi:hypothetical protein